MCYWIVRWKAYIFFVILSPEVSEQTLINLTAIEVVAPPPPSPPPPIFLRSKAWSGLIMKQVINAISALAMKCVVNRTNRLFPEDDNVSANSKPDHSPGRPPRICTFSLPGESGFRPTFFVQGVEILNQRNFLQF